MKTSTLLSLLGLLWLTGCASLEVPSPVPVTVSDPIAAFGAGARLPGTAPPIEDKPKSIYALSGALSPITVSQAHSQAVASLVPPADIWERIRRGFGMPGLDSELVHDREQWYSNRPDYIFRLTERSRKYLFYIVEELERRDMPTELALLPFVESAFNPQAVSSAKAAGMWQFMPATGKNFDLKQNVFRDDRRDVLASTRAALDYLQKLYTLFGDWHLALAAYNWGEGSVGRAIAKNQRAGLGVAYTDLNMPMETRFYVPKLIALKNIIATPAAFNSSLPLIENHPFFQSVDITRDIDVALAAKLAEVPLDDFKALNPSVSRPVILAAGTPQILLPWDNAAIFQRNLEAYSGGRLASWTVWLAPTTMKTAEAAKRVGMKEDALRSINNIPLRVVIKAGSSLLVTRGAQLETDVGLHLADNGQMSLAPEVVLKRMVVKAGKKDSVATLAQRYAVSPANVAEWNKLSLLSNFKNGQQVIIYLPVQTRAVAQNRTKAKPKNSPVQAQAKTNKVTRIAKR